MENEIKEWIESSDKAGAVTLSELMMDFAQWCAKRGCDIKGVTSHTISRVLTSLGYEKKRWGWGITFIITRED